MLKQGYTIRFEVLHTDEQLLKNISLLFSRDCFVLRDLVLNFPEESKRRERPWYVHS